MLHDHKQVKNIITYWSGNVSTLTYIHFNLYVTRAERFPTADLLVGMVLVFVGSTSIKCGFCDFGCQKVNQLRGKSKAVPLHAMEAYWGRGGIAPTHS
jgi:hypothetical protein